MVYSTKKEKISYVFLAIFQLLFIYESLARENKWSKEILTMVPLIVVICLILARFLKKKTIKINRKALLVFFMLCLIKGINSFYFQDFTSDNFVFLLVITTSFLISTLVNPRKYLYALSTAVLFYAIYSLIATYLLHPIYMSGYLRFFKVYYSSSNIPYVDMIFSYVKAWYGNMRNQGFTREPGIFQFFLLLGIVIELNKIDKYHSKKSLYTIVILLITLITTVSTSAYFSIIILFVGYLINISNNEKSRKTLLIICTIIFITIIINFDRWYSFLFESPLLKMANLDKGSYLVRTESIINLLKATIRNPFTIFFGNSIVSGLHFIYKNLSSYEGVDVTGTFFVIMMGFGIPLGMYMINSFYTFSKQLTSNKIIAFFTFLSLFISINSQNLIYNNVLWSILFLIFINKSRNKMEEAA